MTLREQIIEDLSSPHTNIGLLLNGELAFPKKGETAGSMKERLIPHLTEYILASHQAFKAQVLESLLHPAETAPKTGEHIIVTTLDKGGFGTCGGKRQDWTDVVHYWDNPGEEGFYSSYGPDDNTIPFTHWMSLPSEARTAIEAIPTDV